MALPRGTASAALVALVAALLVALMTLVPAANAAITLNGATAITDDGGIHVYDLKRNEQVSRRLQRRGTIFVEELGQSATSNVIFAYYASVGMGTPSKPLTMLWDTGSYQMWVSNSVVNAKSSSTFKSIGTTFPTITYVDGTTVAGSYATDNLVIQNISVSNFQFGSAATTDGTTQGYDGIIGMAFSPPASLTQGTKAKTLIDQLGGTVLTSQYFCVWISDDEQTGQLTLGGIDRSRYTGSIFWLPVQPTRSYGYLYWQTPLAALSAIDQNGSVLKNVTADFQTVIDTGTSLALVPKSVAEAINTALGLTVVSTNGYTLYGGYCSRLPDTMPNVVMTFSGLDFNLTRSDYLFQAAGSSGAAVCVSAFAGYDMDGASDTPRAIFGMAVLRHFYTIFSYEANMIGLAIADRSADKIAHDLVAGSTAGIMGSASSTSSKSGAAATVVPSSMTLTAIAGLALWSVLQFAL
ncbi:hypothetical protein CXG81DRAFT_24822 [Caulochytrium protostelioides]|uniref:Peptidase A1 domain-containing protein n=1 Tax=Caulochytrium protostelioides TaxID=1555241 RepID=A0A4P9XB11_9FUNG|nr:hypothetical protein CXG81DRAFT_24822 [Caulochytrium protostelioides]|eukprot:RKP02535.1 hypothetical protein CXG81DRAFT_24822 [Caulochytrium protostelioides]